MYNESESKVNEEKKFKLTFKIISNTSNNTKQYINIFKTYISSI